jgi:hypothetical protein
MHTDPPAVSRPLGYGTIRVELPGCATPLPPVREAAQCNALEIGKSIDASDVCELLESLKQWVVSSRSTNPSVHPNDWTQVRAVCISRAGRVPSMSQPPPIPPPPQRSFLWEQKPISHRPGLRLDADFPNRSLRIGVQTSEQGRLEYYVTSISTAPPISSNAFSTGDRLPAARSQNSPGNSTRTEASTTRPACQ